MTTPAPRWVGWVLDWTEPEAEGRGAKGNGGQREWANHPTLPFATALNGAARLMGMAER
jgi:hypothetical protein